MNAFYPDCLKICVIIYNNLKLCSDELTMIIFSSGLDFLDILVTHPCTNISKSNCAVTNCTKLCVWNYLAMILTFYTYPNNANINIL